MLQLCGDCAQQAVPILMNPATWLLALAALTAVVTTGGKKKSKGKGK